MGGQDGFQVSFEMVLVEGTMSRKFGLNSVDGLDGMGFRSVHFLHGFTLPNI